MASIIRSRTVTLMTGTVDTLRIGPGVAPTIVGGVVFSGGLTYDPDGVIHGTDRADVLNGEDNAHMGNWDTIYGYGGNDQIFGGLGNDWITGGWGADMIDGGEGDHDISIYDDSPEGVEVNLATGRGTWGTANGDTLVNIEDVAGSNYNDVLIGNDAANNLHGLGGDDRLMGGAGADLLTGGDGAHDAADYSDSAVGVSVNLVNGRGFGGTAEGDTLEGIEDLLGSAQDDFFTGNDAANYLYGAGGHDRLKGGGGADWLEGVSGNDLLKGGGGADTLIGGTGINTASYDGSGAGVFVSLQDGIAAFGDAEGDRLYNIQNLTGSANGDTLWGNYDANVLNGMNGADTLKGYGGADTLIGGAGGDRFAWTALADTGATIATADRVTDFNAAQGDKLDLSGIDANAYATGNQAFTFIGSAAFTGAPGQLNFVHAGGETIIQMQTGVDVDVEAVIRLAGTVTPDASWFIL